MTDFNGKYVWFELNTTDLEAAAAFYAAVAGWVPRDAGMPGMRYTLVGPADHAVGGMMALTDEMKAGGACPGWTGYVAVDDVDAAAAQTRRLGGQVFVPPQDIPGVGRFSIVCDPQGAVLSLFKGTPSEGTEPPPPPAPGTPGHIGWHELHTTSLDGALAFYGELFGWRKGETMDMGPNGVYQLFATGAQGDNADGGMVLKQPDAPRPCWLYYINVASVDTSLARIVAGGGKVLMGPHQVPGGSWIVLGLDPQGAAFAVVGPR
jgi:uncharacterized protein